MTVMPSILTLLVVLRILITEAPEEEYEGFLNLSSIIFEILVLLIVVI